MAKQHGTNPIIGTIDGYSYYYNKEHGFLMRRKGGPSRKQVKQSSQFDIPRRNSSEFGRASHYGKLIRTGFWEMRRLCKDASMNTRLSSILRKILKMDGESEFGKRDLRRNNLATLKHFEWDSKSLSRKYFELPVETTVSSGMIEVTAGISLTSRPRGADAWQLISLAVTIDFKTDKTKTDLQQSDLYEFEKGDFAESFSHYYPAHGELFHGMLIAWYAYDAAKDEYAPLKQEHVNAGFIRYIEKTF
jgi:hypothetical protein